MRTSKPEGVVAANLRYGGRRRRERAERTNKMVGQALFGARDLKFRAPTLNSSNLLGFSCVCEFRRCPSLPFLACHSPPFCHDSVMIQGCLARRLGQQITTPLHRLFSGGATWQRNPQPGLGRWRRAGRITPRARKQVAAVQGGSAVASAARPARDPASLSLVGQPLRHAVLVPRLDRIGDSRNSGRRPRAGATR